jgi:hypothetical protein
VTAYISTFKDWLLAAYPIAIILIVARFGGSFADDGRPMMAVLCYAFTVWVFYLSKGKSMIDASLTSVIVVVAGLGLNVAFL